MISQEQKRERAAKILAYLKEHYPEPKTELSYETPFQCLVAVMLSAQATDKKVNEVTPAIFERYKTACDFAELTESELAEIIKQISFYNNKARNIIKSARIICREHNNTLPQSVEHLVALPGVAYKTAHVVLGEVYDIWDGIPTDTHVRRFALRFELTEQTDLTKISKDLEQLFPREDWKYVNNGLVLYGRYVCPARKHDCTEHTLTKLIPSAAHIWPKAR